MQLMICHLDRSNLTILLFGHDYLLLWSGLDSEYKANLA